MKYVVNETVIRTTVINGEEKVLGTTTRTPITENDKVNTLIYAMRFINKRIEGYKEVNEHIVMVTDRTKEKNVLDLLFKGEEYCEIIWEENGLFIIEKLICKLEEI